MTTGADTHRSSGSTAESGRRRRSVEVEYWVIDERGRLTEPGPMADAAEGVEREFVRPLLEIKTSPCETTAQLREQLYGRLSRVLEVGEAEGKKLVPLATPLYADEIRELPHERTRIQNRVVGEEFECVRHCAGTHVHFEQLPGRETDQLNVLTAIDPALALVNSSPYFQGSRVAASARSVAYRWKAYDSLPRQGQLWPYVDSTEEWATRLHRRYEEFVTEAVARGVPRADVESCFDPESAVWTPVKLRAEFPTVEWRSPDAALPDQVLQLADQLGSLMDHLADAEVCIDGDEGRVTDDRIVIPTFDVVENRARRAVETGVQARDVRSYLKRMGFDVSAFTPLTRTLDAGESLSPERARELRLKYADRLRESVTEHGPIAAD